jgi:predicted Zn finger-like uncharacterized protein
MKFLCPSCKAKYQIADEKIAGRSVRMKCRKCDFLIPITPELALPETLAPMDGELIAMTVPPAPSPPVIASEPPAAAHLAE